jgi:diguanylate cyclase (GGDEF)-like protein
LRKGEQHSLEFLFSLALFIAGSAEAFSIPWLRMGYFPFMVSLAALYERKIVLSLLLLIPFLELRNLLTGMTTGEIIFLVSLSMTVGISLFLKNGLSRGTMNKTSFTAAAANGDSDPGILSVSDEKVISHYLESMFRPDDEIAELLMGAKNTVFADTVNLFVSAGESLRLRCSTDSSTGIIPSNGGLIYQCFHERKPLISSEISERKIEVGYLKKDTISSLVAVPVMDGNFPLGVLAADSARFHAFSSADGDILQIFSRQVMKILQRERVYPQIQRSYDALEILNEESAKLLSSLNVEVIVQNLIDGSHRIAPSQMIFFTARGREVEIFRSKGLPDQEEKVFDMKGTLLEMAVKNGGPMYFSDVRAYRTPLPFKTTHVNSIFILPMFYEKDLLGILILLFEKINALSPNRIELLKVLGNQASTSIANANFHAEIERLAITDGLTGLFNHRHFQEQLAKEFNRLDRLSGHLSLLLIDIDHFKKINDTYGHPVGDSVLKRVAGIIRKAIRNIDIAARYGGEEFAVILIGTDAGGAGKMAERLRKAVANIGFSAEKDTFHVTISIGISTNIGDVRKKEELVEMADKALYHAKRSGRNRSVLWSEIGGQT